MADLKISELTLGTPEETDIIPYVDLATNTTKKAPKSTLKGLKGDKGDTGATGATGPQGIQGLKGDKPAHDWSGTSLRFENPNGSEGDYVDLKGDTGSQGIQGVKGDKGETGDKGDKPAHTWTGTTLSFENTDGSYDAGVDLKGDTGEQGIQGPKGDKGDPGTGSGDFMADGSIPMTGGITNSTSTNPLTTKAESWVGPSSTTGVYFKGGNVGIGTTNPVGRLNVQGTAGNGTRIISQATGLTSGDFADYNFYNSSGSVVGAFRYVPASGSGYGGPNSINFVQVLNAPLTFGTNNNVNMTMLGNGNVGIGTTNPNSKLSINGGLHVGGDSDAGDNNLLVDGSSRTLNLGINKSAAPGIGIEMLNTSGGQGLRIENPSETDIGFSTFKTADNYARFSFLGDGKMEWGAGATVADTNLYRSAANTLKTDDNFVANNIAAGATVSGSNTGDQVLPVKATGAEINTGTDDAKFITAKAIKDSILFNLPEGVMYNGKIVPSVTSGNLTVALKGMDGNDPSATNPVYVRIGGVVRSITGALSASDSGGAAYNAASSELSGKEIDYFVYLGYSTITNSVKVGRSRIPYGTLVSDFSGTPNNEKYNALAYPGECNSTDIVVNVGRFAATETAPYTWSVPTFTASNLIQRPIYETRWLNFTPSFTWTAGTAPTNIVTGGAQYKIRNSTLDLAVYFYNMTAGATVTKAVLPVPFTENFPQGVVQLTGFIGVGNTQNLSQANIYVNNVSVFCASCGATTIGISGSYPI